MLPTPSIELHNNASRDLYHHMTSTNLPFCVATEEATSIPHPVQALAINFLAGTFSSEIPNLRQFFSHTSGYCDNISYPILSVLYR